MPKLQHQGAEASLEAFLASLNDSGFKLNVVGKGLVKIGNAIPPRFKNTEVRTIRSDVYFSSQIQISNYHLSIAAPIVSF
jgi:hypothetical protein